MTKSPLLSSENPPVSPPVATFDAMTCAPKRPVPFRVTRPAREPHGLLEGWRSVDALDARAIVHLERTTERVARGKRKREHHGRLRDHGTARRILLRLTDGRVSQSQQVPNLVRRDRLRVEAAALAGRSDGPRELRIQKDVSLDQRTRRLVHEESGQPQDPVEFRFFMVFEADHRHAVSGSGGALVNPWNCGVDRDAVHRPPGLEGLVDGRGQVGRRHPRHIDIRDEVLDGRRPLHGDQLATRRRDTQPNVCVQIDERTGDADDDEQPCGLVS